MASREQIKQAVEKGAAWLQFKQNANGSYGKWGLGSTGLAVMALLAGGVSNSDPAVAKAISYILHSELPDVTYFRSLAVMALIANGEKKPGIFSRVQSDTEWLIQGQGSNPGNKLSFGGWGHSSRPEVADGSNTQYAILALYAASRWGLAVPQKTWAGAVAWYQGNHDLSGNGSYVYSLSKNSRLHSGVSYAITAGALSSLKIINMFTADPAVQFQAQNLLGRALGWLNTNFSVELNPNIPDSWYYYYLYSLQKGCAIEPGFDFHDWYADMADCLVGLQEADGRWASKAGNQSTEIMYTSFALLALTDTDAGVSVKSTYKDNDEADQYADQYNERNQPEESHGERNGKYANGFVERCGDGQEAENESEHKSMRDTSSVEKDVVGHGPEPFAEEEAIQFAAGHLEQRPEKNAERAGEAENRDGFEGEGAPESLEEKDSLGAQNAIDLLGMEDSAEKQNSGASEGTRDAGPSEKIAGRRICLQKRFGGTGGKQEGSENDEENKKSNEGKAKEKYSYWLPVVLLAILGLIIWGSVVLLLLGKF